MYISPQMNYPSRLQSNNVMNSNLTNNSATRTINQGKINFGSADITDFSKKDKKNEVTLRSFTKACTERGMGTPLTIKTVLKYYPLVKKNPGLMDFITQKGINYEYETVHRIESTNTLFEIFDMLTPDSTSFFIDKFNSDSLVYESSTQFSAEKELIEKHPKTTHFLREVHTSDGKPLQLLSQDRSNLCEHFESYEDFDKAKEEMNYILNIRSTSGEPLYGCALSKMIDDGFRRSYKMYDETGLFKHHEIVDMVEKTNNKPEDFDAKQEIINIKMGQIGTHSDEQLRQEIRMLTTISPRYSNEARKMAVADYSTEQIEKYKEATFVVNYEADNLIEAKERVCGMLKCLENNQKIKLDYLKKQINKSGSLDEILKVLNDFKNKRNKKLDKPGKKMTKEAVIRKNTIDRYIDVAADNACWSMDPNTERYDVKKEAYQIKMNKSEAKEIIRQLEEDYQKASTPNNTVTKVDICPPTPLPDFVTKVDENIYRGRKPELHEMKQLKDMGITTIVDFSTERSEFNEAECAAKYDIKYIALPFDMCGLKDEQIKKFFEITQKAKENNEKMYVHCLYGTDRTGVMINMYKMHNGLPCQDSNSMIGSLAEDLYELYCLRTKDK